MQNIYEQSYQYLSLSPQFQESDVVYKDVAYIPAFGIKLTRHNYYFELKTQKSFKPPSWKTTKKQLLLKV